MNKNLTKISLLLVSFVFATVSLVGCGGGGGSSDGGATANVFTAAMLDANPTYYVTYTDDTDGSITQEEIAISGGAGASVAAITSGAYVATITSSEFYSTGELDSTDVFTADVTLNQNGTLTAVVEGESATILSITDITESYLEVTGVDSTDTWSDFWYFAKPAGWLTDDGKAYLYATDTNEVIDIVFDTDYFAVDTWGSGAVLDNAYAGDADYNPCFAVDNTTSPAWGGLGAVAFAGFNTGYFSEYTALHFKFKAASDTAVNVKFPGATVQEEIIYNVSSATDLGNGWYDFTIRLANHGDLAASTEFAFLATGDYLITDIYFTDEDLATPALGDIDAGGSFYLKSGDGNNEIDLRYGTEYQEISVWSSGTVITDIVDAEYGDAWQMTPGNWWGRDAAVIAFTGFAAGHFSDYTTLTFKFNPDGVYDAINVKFPGGSLGADGEVVYDLATYGTSIGTGGWYEMVIPMSAHGDVSTTTEFAILTDGTTDFSVTDIFFQ